MSALAFGGAPGSSGLFIIVKVITIEDPGGASGAQPGNNLTANVYGDSDAVAFCDGRCDAADSFDNNLEASTDGNGVLEYTVRVTVPADGSLRAGQITEVFGSSTCTSSYSATAVVGP